MTHDIVLPGGLITQADDPQTALVTLLATEYGIEVTKLTQRTSIKTYRNGPRHVFFREIEEYTGELAVTDPSIHHLVPLETITVDTNDRGWAVRVDGHTVIDDQTELLQRVWPLVLRHTATTLPLHQRLAMSSASLPVIPASLASATESQYRLGRDSWKQCYHLEQVTSNHSHSYRDLHHDSDYLVLGGRDEIFRANKAHKQLTKIILVRHGRTDYNEKKRGDSAGKARLTADGHKQSIQIVSGLASHEIDAVYSSPLQRCLDTIQPFVTDRDITVQTDDRLREISAPAVQDKPFDCGTIIWGNDPV